MVDIIDFVLEIFLEIKYWIKHGKQRKHEKENNLPKSVVWAPYTKQFFILFLIFIPVCFVFIFFISIGENEKKTEKIMMKVSKLLEAEKKQFGKYPSELKTIIRNNPLRKGLELDSWKTAFVYTISEDGKNYQLISLGGDGKLGTKDDILHSSK
jgi:hypothetical protein